MGYIYIIENDVTDKVYIGQTTRSIDLRFSEHLRCARILYKTKSKLYTAIKEIGECHFSISLLMECEDKDLDREEQYYISQYNSYRNGYNSTPGGAQYRKDSLEPEWLENLITDYRNNVSYKDMAIKYRVSLPYINKLLGDSKVEGRDASNHTIKGRRALLMYDKDFNNPIYFESIKQAVDYLNKYTEYSVSEFNGYTYIVKACSVGNIAYNHRWQLADELYYNGINFRSIFDIEAYKNGKLIVGYCGDYAICDGALSNIIKDNKYYCKDCGKLINKGATYCKECFNKHNQESIPDKETLQYLISKYSYEEIGRQYGVTGKAVRKWCDKHNLVESNQRDSSGVTCIELNMYFGTFKDAAEYLVNNKLTKARNIGSIAYKISSSKRYGDAYCGFHWR